MNFASSNRYDTNSRLAADIASQNTTKRRNKKRKTTTPFDSLVLQIFYAHKFQLPLRALNCKPLTYSVVT